MNISLTPRFLTLVVSLVLIAGACAGSAGEVASTTAPAVALSEQPEPHDGEHSHDGDEDHSTDIEAASGTGLDLALFFPGSLTEEATTEPCTLSGGVETTCYRITVAGDPVTYDTGPFCPATITDTAEAGGIWLDGNDVYDVDGAFIAGLAELYDDPNWQMFDEDGNVNITETAEEFDLAARPDVDPSLQNHCVEGRLEWLDNGEPISSTVLIPTAPVLADGVAEYRGNLGVTLDGVVIAQPAPVDAILSAYTIAAFDDCGGHYNPNDGYHLHGATGCSEAGEAGEGETSIFAYAIDGFAVHSPLDDAADLDECNGHKTEELGYHYHANGAEQNLVIQCLIGQTAINNADAGSGGAGGGAGGGRGERGERLGPPPGDG